MLSLMATRHHRKNYYDGTLNLTSCRIASWAISSSSSTTPAERRKTESMIDARQLVAVVLKIHHWIAHVLGRSLTA